MAVKQEIIDMLSDIKANGGCIRLADMNERLWKDLSIGIVYLKPVNAKAYYDAIGFPSNGYIYYANGYFYISVLSSVGCIKYEYPLCLLKIIPQSEDEFVDMLQ